MSTTSSPSVQQPSGSGESLLQSLSRRRFLVVTGKGGVGKSAVAASLATLFARGGADSLRGRRRKVLIVEIDPRENVHQLLAAPPSGGDVVRIDDRLFVQNLKPRAALDQLVRRHLAMGLLQRRVLSSETYQQLSEGAPGLKEVAVLDYAEHRTRERGEDGLGPFDLVILDAPATGHGVSLLAAPLLLSEVIQDGPVGRRARELASFISRPEALGIVAVTLAEELPAQEVLELFETIRQRLGRRADALVINGLYPRLPEAWEEDPEAQVAAGDAAALAWIRRRRINQREVARLEASWNGPQALLPLLPLARGPELIKELQQGLAEAFGECCEATAAEAMDSEATEVGEER
ncbi:MAG: ArsA-related P-loop ATPase [Acidobacteriota bacterium]